MGDTDLVKAVLNWAEFNPSFDTGFVESLEEKLDRFGELTDNQRLALERIVEGFNIDVEKYS